MRVRGTGIIRRTVLSLLSFLGDCAKNLEGYHEAKERVGHSVKL